MLTSTYAAGNAEEREQAGILRCVNKPVRQSELYEVVRDALKAVPASTNPESGVLATPASGDSNQLHGRVLLAEDDLVNQEVAKAILASLGLVVDVAVNGEEALKLFEREAYDVVLMDGQMPVMDGYRATAAIRAREAGGVKRLPIIALTANAMDGDRQQCLAAGMDDYLAKPYSKSQLRQVLSRWLRQGTSTADVAIPALSAMPERVKEIESLGAINTNVLSQLRELDPAGGMGLARKILQAYLNGSIDSMAQIERALAENDAETLRRAAHSLKSSSANVGAERLSAMFKWMEGLGKEGKMGEVSTAFDATRREYAQVLVEIRALLAEAP
jgi:CheY-like chemotaxis protein/HPt (histidine-containing phosphotransfer) domain-containing protein